MAAPSMMRVHSNDLHQHIVEQVSECFESALYTDLAVRCKGGQIIYAHKLVLSAVSPFLKRLLESEDIQGEENQTIDLPFVKFDIMQLLVDVIYNGSVEATMDDLRAMIKLARYLYISIPISDAMLTSLNLKLTPMPPLPPQTKITKISQPAKDDTLESIQAIVSKHKFQPNPGLAMLKQNQQKNAVKLPQNPLPLPPFLQQVATGAGQPQAKRMREDPNGAIDLQALQEAEQAREQKNIMFNDVVSASYDPASSRYTCEICQSTYSHPGNFKQHLGKHERESGAVTAIYTARHGGLPDMTNVQPSAKSGRASFPGSIAGLNGVTVNRVNEGGHLDRALASSFASRVDAGEGVNKHQYNCDICGRSFKHPGNFKQHLQSHQRKSDQQNLLFQKNHMLMQQQRQQQNNGNHQQVKQLSQSLGLNNSSITITGGGGGGGAVNRNQNIVAANIQRAKQQMNNGNSSPKLTLKLHRCGICNQAFESEPVLFNHKQCAHGIPLNVLLQKKQQEAEAKAKAASALKVASSLMARGGLNVTSSKQASPQQKVQQTPPSASPQPQQQGRFRCDVPGCSMVFGSEPFLARHKEIAHRIRMDARMAAICKPHLCNLCGKRFYKQPKLEGHIQTHHGGAPNVAPEPEESEEPQEQPDSPQQQQQLSQNNSDAEESNGVPSRLSKTLAFGGVTIESTGGIKGLKRKAPEPEEEEESNQEQGYENQSEDQDPTENYSENGEDDEEMPMVNASFEQNMTEGDEEIEEQNQEMEESVDYQESERSGGAYNEESAVETRDEESESAVETRDEEEEPNSSLVEENERVEDESEHMDNSTAPEESSQDEENEENSSKPKRKKSATTTSSGTSSSSSSSSSNDSDDD